VPLSCNISLSISETQPRGVDRSKCAYVHTCQAVVVEIREIPPVMGSDMHPNSLDGVRFRVNSSSESRSIDVTFPVTSLLHK
jgi:hypothetical protein